MKGKLRDFKKGTLNWFERYQFRKVRLGEDMREFVQRIVSLRAVRRAAGTSSTQAHQEARLTYIFPTFENHLSWTPDESKWGTTSRRNGKRVSTSLARVFHASADSCEGARREITLLKYWWRILLYTQLSIEAQYGWRNFSYCQEQKYQKRWIWDNCMRCPWVRYPSESIACPSFHASSSKSKQQLRILGKARLA